MKKLPNKLSSLIKLAIKDLVSVERSKNYTVDMGMWHVPCYSGKCAVCLAGAVIARELEISPKIKYSPCYMDDSDPNYKKLLAIDAVRGCNWGHACYMLGISSDKLTDDFYKKFPYISYDREPSKFKENLLSAAKELERLGL